MKRSAAPSVSQSKKRPAAFVTPWASSSSGSSGQTRKPRGFSEGCSELGSEISKVKVNEENTDHMCISSQPSLKQALHSLRHGTLTANGSSNSITYKTAPNTCTSPKNITPHTTSIKGTSIIMGQAKMTSFVSPVTSTTTSVIKENVSSSNTDTFCYYRVMWCKLSKKKHKTWEGDAILVCHGRTVTLKDMEGKDIGHGTGYKSSELSQLVEGSTLPIGGKEIEVMGIVSEEEWQSGRCFHNDTTVAQTNTAVKAVAPVKGFQNPSKLKDKTTEVSNRFHSSMYQSKFDATAENALVLPRPSPQHQLKYNTLGLPLVDVVVDPHLTHHLRPHQREGVMFLYECMMNMREYTGSGAILADEMGLGKSLQCITLIWTLLKQGPYGGKPVMRRVVIVTPGSLVKNWQKEFQKWLGFERLKIFAASSDNRPEDFVRSPIYAVLLISYELFMKCYDKLSKVSFDMIICDEGHRLKNTQIKTFTLLSSLSIIKRIVLSGTPIQNDLMEFYAIAEFCNPGLLGSQSGYRKIYEEPIVRSRQVDATEMEQEIGRKRAEELMRLVNLFYLRRTQEINKKYLPPKVENVIFCRPTSLQVNLYNHLISSQVIRSCLSRVHTTSDQFSPHLMCINALKKLCNCPSLLYSVEEGTQSQLYKGIKSCYPEGYDPMECRVEYSGKLWVVAAMLEYLHVSSNEKIVIVSNYTQTLDILENLCKLFKYSFLRLDGQTPLAKRQNLVERFNNKTIKDFVFLLSSKAGGVGLNLIGASRLILYDIDWNPANDAQAMARVWRDGQTENVNIYRLLTTGTIEEKIFQRQISKLSLSDVIENEQSANHDHGHFSLEELQDLFSFDDTNHCITHDQLNCNCLTEVQQKEEKETNKENDLDVSRLCLLGRHVIKEKKILSVDKLMEWTHTSPPFESMGDKLIVHAAENITFVFQNATSQQSL